MTNSMPVRATSSSRRSEPCSVVRRDALTPRDRDEMFALLSLYFTNTSRTVFERDLAEKDWAVVLRDDDGHVDGFSTLLLTVFDGAAVFFSGDTIVARHRWGSYDLPRFWGKHVFNMAATLPHRDVFWFLISSGFRTYRYLPLFFREFDPACRRETSPETRTLLDRIARARFGDAYDAAAGVVRLATPAPLRDLSDVDTRAARDPHVRFFVNANPGHADGDELACLVRVHPANLTPAGLRMIR